MDAPAAAPPLDLLFRALSANSRLSDEDRAAIAALPHHLRSLEASTYLVREGDPPGSCPVLVSGFAYRQKTTGDGRRQLLSLHIPGDALDFQSLFLDVADHSVQMLTRGQVAFVARAALQDMARSRAAVGHAILVSLLIEASIFREWIVNVGQRDAKARTAHLLCEFVVRMRARGLADDDLCELPITQEQLADATGMTTVHVNRTLKALEAEGLIRRDRRAIAFPSWDKLRDVADFNRRYLHLERQVAGGGS